MEFIHFLTNQVLPIAHVSPRDHQNIRLVNPAAVDLPAYDKRLKNAIEEYHQRLDLLVWKNLSDEEREKYLIHLLQLICSCGKSDQSRACTIKNHNYLEFICY